LASDVFRSCPECGGEQPFEQFHPAPAECPDSPGGDCPEWACTSCGSALWAGVLPRPAPPALVALRRKVA
jgi:hypothetical protein